MALPEITKYENFEDPSSPLYVPEEERSTWDYYRPIDGVYEYQGDGIQPYSFTDVWINPETKRPLSLEEASNYFKVYPSGEVDLINNNLKELEVPNWVPAYRYVPIPTGYGGITWGWEGYKRRNTGEWDGKYRPEDDLGSYGPSALEQLLQTHPEAFNRDDPADNFLNQGIFDILTLGGTTAGRQALKWGAKGTQWLLKNSTPSALTKGLSYYFPQYTSALNTAGLWGDAAMYSWLAKDSLDRLTSEDGINKTINLYGNGDIWGGTKSLAGDVLDVSLLTPFAQGFYNYGKGLIDPIARQTAFFRQIHPFGYQGHWKDGLKFFKDWALYPIEQYPAIPQYKPLPVSNPTYLVNLRTRQEAIRLSLGFPQSSNSPYTLNPDGTYSYNYINIFKKLVPENEQDFVRSVAALNINNLFKQAYQSGVIYKPGASGVIIDPITGAGGNVKVTVTQNGGFVIEDIWDLEPFKHKRWLPKPIRDFEVIKFLGGKPLVLKHEIPQGFYLHSEVLGK